MNLINTQTSLYGVIGNPVKHSKSPLLFNFLFQKYNINAVYLAFENQNLESLISSMRTLNIKGFSVTLPHKENSMPLIDEFKNNHEGKISQKLGCINTILNDNGKLYGYNFDGYGAIDALMAKEPCYYKKKIGIIGNGGAARGIALSLMLCYENLPQQVDILCRNRQKATPLVNDINSISKKHLSKKISQAISLKSQLENNLENSKSPLPYDILINTTPLGMSPNTKQSPLTTQQIPSNCLVYDIVYTPKKTKLLKIAEQKNCQIITGDKMFLGQAKRQFELWTDITVTMAEISNFAKELNLFP